MRARQGESMLYDKESFREHLDKRGLPLGDEYYDFVIFALKIGITEDDKYRYNNAIDTRGDNYEKKVANALAIVNEALELIGEHEIASYLEVALDNAMTVNIVLASVIKRVERKLLALGMTQSKFTKIRPAIVDTFIQACNEYPPTSLEREIIQDCAYYDYLQEEADLARGR
jgi:hypothetical protein